MIDRPQQLLLALALLVLLVLLLRLTSPRRRHRSPSVVIRSGWVLLRLTIGFLILLAFLSAMEATTFVDANICIDLSPGVEWCHEETEAAGQT
ncbi:MAG: hypothetical protein PVG91_09810 [Gammaproteobacteria bacterium]